MDINKKYEQWLNYEDMDASLKAELAGMTEEQKEKPNQESNGLLRLFCRQQLSCLDSE